MTAKKNAKTTKKRPMKVVVPLLPSTLINSEPHAQRLWQKAYMSAEKTYGEGGSAPRRVAYAALKHEYEKQGHRWVRKSTNGPSDPQAAQGGKEALAHPKATARGKVAKTAKEAEEKSKQARAEAGKWYRTHRAELKTAEKRERKQAKKVAARLRRKGVNAVTAA